jgi:hypothetical protein
MSSGRRAARGILRTVSPGIEKLGGLFSVDQTGRMLGVSPWTVRRYLKIKLLDPTHVGGRIMIAGIAIDALLARGKPK